MQDLVDIPDVLPKPRVGRAQSRKRVEPTRSDEATTAFVRRVLCADELRTGVVNEDPKGRGSQRPLEDILPPLTSSNEIDLQLYALIAIIVKDFVHSWYSKITADHEFTNELVQVIAHCTRGLEQRIRKMDVEALMFDELPEIMISHVDAYRTAHSNPYCTSLSASPRDIYHSIHPHPALSPVPQDIPGSVTSDEQADNEANWRRVLVQQALLLLLPPEDLKNPCLKALVSDIFSEIIIGNGICGKICEGWFIWDIVTNLVELIESSQNDAPSPAEDTPPAPSRLEQFGLLTEEHAPEKHRNNWRNCQSFATPVLLVFAQIMRYATLSFSIFWTFYTQLSDASNIAPRPAWASPTLPGLASKLEDDSTDDLEPPRTTTPRPILGMSWSLCCSRIFSMDLRMPWLVAACGLLQWLMIHGPGRLACTNSRLDRLLANYISTTLLDPARIPQVLLAIRSSMFPNNSLGPGRVPPTADEVMQIRRRCASKLLNAIPGPIRTSLFASRGDIGADERQMEQMLDVFGDTYLNKHVIVATVDLVFLRLFPELNDHRCGHMSDDDND